MSSKEQKADAADEVTELKKDSLKGIKRPAEDKGEDLKKLKKVEENGDDDEDDVEDEDEAEGEEEEEEDLPEGEEDFDEEGEG